MATGSAPTAMSASPSIFAKFADAVNQLGLYWLVLNEQPPAMPGVAVKGLPMGRPLRVLIVEDNERDAAILIRELKRGGYELTFERVETETAMARALSKQTWDLVLSDYALPQFGALAAVRLVEKAGLDLPFIVVSGSVGEEAAVEVMREGAHDFLFKGKFTRMIPVIERELREAGRRAQHRDIQARLRQMEKIEALGQLTGGIAHDFNNILAVIVGMTELVAASVADDPKLSAMVKQIDELAERGAQLVQRLLTFARKRPLETRVARSERDGRARHLDAGADARRAYRPARAPCRKTSGPRSPIPSQLEDAILNLAVNARDAMPKGGRLVIETSNVHLDQDYAAQNADVVPGDYAAIVVTGYRHGHAPRGHRARVRAVLHDQGGRPRHRPGPQHGLWLRQAVRRAREGLQRGRPWHEHQAVLAEGRAAGAGDRGCPLPPAVSQLSSRWRDHSGRRGRPGRAQDGGEHPRRPRLPGPPGSGRPAARSTSCTAPSTSICCSRTWSCPTA